MLEKRGKKVTVLRQLLVSPRSTLEINTARFNPLSEIAFVCGGGGREGTRQQNQSGAWLPLLKFQSLPLTHRVTEGTLGAKTPQPA